MLAQTFKNELKKKKKWIPKYFLRITKKALEKQQQQQQQNWAWLFSPLKKATYAYKKATWSIVWI